MTESRAPRAIAYTFEAKGIQSYILVGGRLRDAVGASILVDSLCLDPADPDTPPSDPTGKGDGPPSAGLLDDAMRAAGLQAGSGLIFTRRAAGAFTFVAIGPDMAGRVIAFRQLWTLTVAMAAPGLDFIDMLGEGDSAPEALRKAIDGGQARRSRLSTPLPPVPPPVRRAPRTGLGAVGVDAADPDDREPVDAATRRKRAHFKATREGGRWWTGLLAGQKAAEQPLWPANLESEFPFLGEDRTIGLLHADGNRMGQILILLQERLGAQVAAEALPPEAFSRAETEYLGGLRKFSTAAGRATASAFAIARDECLLPYAAPPRRATKPREFARPGAMMPARPILMGGDDLTILLRGDVALPFARRFLEAFEEQAVIHLDTVLTELGDGFPPLTACAGIAFVGDSFPFDRALRLAEDLCKHAKEAAKVATQEKGDGLRVPSSLSFHRATASLLDDYARIEAEELTRWDGTGAARKPALLLSMQPYAVRGECFGLPALDDLEALKALFVEEMEEGGAPALGRGPARELVELLQTMPELARQRFARWRQVLGARNRSLTLFDERMTALGMVGETHLEKPAPGLALARTPILDALTWHVVTQAERDAS